MSRTDKKTALHEILINKAGQCHYNEKDSIGNLIRYISRENGKSKNDLVCCGAFGATDFTDIDTTIKQFECVQMLHTRKGGFGRYIDHEIYSFSADEEKKIAHNNISVERLAEEMALDFYKDGFQVYYGVHKKDDRDNNLHIHFAVNTVNFITENKRREYKSATKSREQRLHCIVEEALQNTKFLMVHRK